MRHDGECGINKGLLIALLDVYFLNESGIINIDDQNT